MPHGYSEAPSRHRTVASGSIASLRCITAGFAVFAALENSEIGLKLSFLTIQIKS